MSIPELLSRLVKLDIKLWVDGERLRYSAPQGAMTPELQAELVKHKTDVVARLRASVSSAEQGVVTGPMPLIPITMFSYAHVAPQAWWRALEVLVEVPQVLGPMQVAEAVRRLVWHHDGLRLRLVKGDTDYELFTSDSDDRVFLECDLSALPKLDQGEAIQAAIDEQWDTLNILTGPLFRVVFFNLGLHRPAQMLLVLHHFAADAFSIPILLDDFQKACQQLLMGEVVKLPSKTTSLKHWAERMYSYIQSDAAEPEFAYWRSLPWGRVQSTPVDHPNVTHSDFFSLEGSLSTEETRALLFKVPAAYSVDMLDVLLTACVLTFARCAQLQPLLVLINHHGRNSIFDDMDVSRTVGNFYTSFPLLLDIDLELSKTNPEKVLKLVAEQRARVPNDGTTWPWISYYSSEPMIGWQDNIKIVKNVNVNYLGHVTPNAQEQVGMFRQVYKPPDKAAMHLYDVTAMTPHTCTSMIEADQFKINWKYFSGLHEQYTIKDLLQEYLAVLQSFIRMAV